MLANRMVTLIGLDIGGTKITVAAATEDGRILARYSAATPTDLPAGLALVEQMIERVRGEARPAVIGAAIGGPLDAQSGVVSPLHQPDWRDVPLKNHMEERWNCPFAVDVDTNLAALAEYLADEGRPRRLLYITISTGMGGGFLIDGTIYRGVDGRHPEIAHQSVPIRCADPSVVSCECGAPDCLEALVSGNGIRRIYGRPAEELDAQAWSEVAYHLGQGLRNLAAILAPTRIILGGGVALGRGQKLIDAAGAVMASRLKIVPVPELALARQGEDAPLKGALILAKRTLAEFRGATPRSGRLT